MNRLLQNWNLKLTSLVLAVALWTHVRGEVNPMETATFSVRLEPTAPEKLMIMNADRLPKVVRVTLRAPRVTLREIKGGLPPNPLAPVDEAMPLPARFAHARLDFSLARTGQQDLPIKVDSSLDETEVIGVKPSVVEVVLDQPDVKTFPVKAVMATPLPEGFYLDKVGVQPIKARAFGPAQRLQRVASVRAETKAAAYRSDKMESAAARLVAVDSNGRRLEDIQLVPPEVQVNGMLKEKLEVQELKIDLSQDGDVPDGYRVVGMSAQPASVRVRASRRVLDDISTVPLRVDVTGQKLSFSRHLKLAFPEGITALKNSPVRVDVTVAPFSAGGRSGSHLPAPSDQGADSTPSPTAAP